MNAQKQENNAGYTTVTMALVVSLCFGLMASVVMGADCPYVSDSNKKCEGKADPATTGECTPGDTPCGSTPTCSGSKTEYDYTGCDECKPAAGSTCSEWTSWTPETCVGGNCGLKQRTKTCKCYGPTSNKTCGIDPADPTDWEAMQSVRQDECF